MEIVSFEFEKEYINDFIKLPKKLYSKNNNMEDSNTIRQFLKNNHVLSKYFKLNKYLIYDNKNVVGRFGIIEYPDEQEICYLGFFECINDNKVSKFIFDNAYKFAKRNKYKKIVGPVDASFWNKYRLKINLFDNKPYTGEPYNLEYYYKMFLDNDYKVLQHYVSNIFEKVDKNYSNEKFIKHYNDFIEHGYEIIKPKKEDFSKCIEEIYYMIMELYKDFPVFKHLFKEDFISIFSSYEKIINMDMVRIAYFKKEAVGFCVSIPNYNNKVYHLNIPNIIKVLYTKKHPKEYVMLYLGVKKEHTGLGKAIAYSITEELKKNNLPSINALIKDENVNIKYGDDKIVNQYEYVLLERNIK